MNRVSLVLRRQQGLSIVELMIALLLGSLLVGGLVQILTSNSQAFRITESMARTQEFGRIASEILSREARNAGYFGCNAEAFVSNLDIDPTDPNFDDFDWEPGTGVSSDSGLRPNEAILNTDFIYFSGLEGGGLEIVANAPPTAASTKVESKGGGGPKSFLNKGDIIAISDCQGTDIVQVTNISGKDGDLKVTLVTNSGAGTPGNDFSSNTCSNTGNPSAGNNCLSQDYGIGAQILKPYDRIYFIGKSNVTGEPALMMRSIENGVTQTVEMVEGVLDLQVQYGLSVDKRAGVNRWEDSESLSGNDWEQIRAIRASVLVRGGADNTFDDKATLCFPTWKDCTNGHNFTAPDKRMYRAYTFTSNVRNKSS